ncbi:piggyBac transposable element-derived protein 4-like [Schistocerca americana]|uniref:piggyBac transposable element-derived protein 4-like n=1 Tax=Schistocerca americana TaxID=7009 RepID=UPI001F500BD9|nr:piggyBac transposable element-derived protein 4-like [Schistocerca americana]
MSRRGLRDEEIERLLCEIPSDEDSTVDTTDDESDYEASIVAEAIVSSEGEVSESEEESESTPPKRAADTAPTWGQQFNATSGMQFDSESGPSAFIRDIDDPEPIDIFEKIFPKELVELIVFQTNLYATQSGKSFTPTTDNEIRTFLGINILMGIKRMPAYRDYWSSAPELHDRYIASLMAVNRFGWLLRNIHLNDNTLHPEKGHPGYDKLYKLRPVIKILSESFSKCYQPSKHLAIDESMIKFKGRNSMKQYMRDKPIKRGYKVWMLCDKTSYNLKFDIYTGKARCFETTTEAAAAAAWPAFSPNGAAPPFRGYPAPERPLREASGCPARLPQTCCTTPGRHLFFGPRRVGFQRGASLLRSRCCAF